MKILEHKKLLRIISILLILSNYNYKSYSQSQIGNDIVGEAAADYSGSSLSLNDSGNIVAIGATNNNNTNGADAGHVRVYEFNGANWVQKGNDIDGEAIADHFGWSLSLNSIGNIVAIGTPESDQNGSRSGHVKVYEWDEVNWAQKGSTLFGQVSNDRFGGSVCLNSSGNILAIGEVKNIAIDNDYGRVKLYEWDGTDWIQKGTTLVGDEIDDGFASSLSLNSNGNILVIGVPYSADNGSSSGKVKIYEWNGTNWIPKGSDIIGEASDDLSGFSISLNSVGNIIAIGAVGNDDNGTFSGQTRIYEWNGTNWLQKGNDIDGEASSDSSGRSVSLNSDGTKIAIGAPRNDGNETANSYNCGHVRIYEWNGLNWEQKGIDIDGETQGEHSGDRVSLSADGNIVVIASTENYSSSGYEVNAGIVKFFDVSNSALNINEFNFEEKIKIFPNPVQNRLQIQLSSSVLGPTLCILNNIGKVIIRRKINKAKATNLEFDIGDLSSGLYFIKIIDSKGNLYYKKLIKK